VIDFTGGNPVSGRCAPNDTYVGIRESTSTDDLSGPGLEKRIDPALAEVQRLLGTWRAAVQDLVDLTGPESALVRVIRNLDGVVINLRTLTGSGGPIDRTIQSVQDELQSVRKVTDQLNHGRALESALANVDETTKRLRQITDKTDRTLVSAFPSWTGSWGILSSSRAS
jgi:hypothetical protein